MKEFFYKWQALIVALVAVVNTLIAGYLTLAIEHRPVDVPGLVLVLPDKQAVASIPERVSSNHGAGLLAVGLMGVTTFGVGAYFIRRGRQQDIPVEAQGLPGVIGKIALNLAIRYLEVRAPKTPGDLDDNILELLIAIRDSNVLDLLKIKEAVAAINAQRPENVEVVRG